MKYHETMINVCSWTGRPINRLPKVGREPDEDYAYISKLLDVIGDPWCHPNSGGIANVATLAKIYGVGVQQFRRNILPTLGYIRLWGDNPVTNVRSAFAHAKIYRAETNQKWLNNLDLSTDVRSRYVTDSK